MEIPIECYGGPYDGSTVYGTRPVVTANAGMTLDDKVDKSRKHVYLFSVHPSGVVRANYVGESK